MASLSGPIKVFIVQRLACYERPVDVRLAVEATFQVTVTLPQLAAYNPTLASGRRLSKALREVFASTRQKLFDDIGNIAIAHKAYRLRRLQSLLEQVIDHNAPLAAAILEQAAKEQGGACAKRERYERTGAEAPPWAGVARKFSDELDLPGPEGRQRRRKSNARHPVASTLSAPPR